MVGHSSLAWKLAVTLTLAALVGASVAVRAPRRRIPLADLRRIVAGAVALYAAGAAAAITHHRILAGILYGSGIAMCALAAWLSRGADSGGPPGGGDEDDPVNERPPPQPDGAPSFDWAAFERDFRSYTAPAPARAGDEH